MMEHLVAPPRGARRSKKRVGRGDSAGKGSYAGRGLKGQQSRSGGGPRPGFEGGQLPLIKGLPMKRGFNNIFKTHYALVKVGVLDNFDAGERVTPEILCDRGHLRERNRPLKVLGDGEISKPVTVAAHKFTSSARQKIEAAGGTVEEL